ncbi:hypothetical protein AB751O23_AZ_00080 [Chlamydiales bacterium SCGC AB-751-O23]|jgi:lipopolysaccharide export system permease protein|nr:hypothetical protein AB751O23_AZ_00080 [Chlamydiales bacterium SCGC AB-751-O23]
MSIKNLSFKYFFSELTKSTFLFLLGFCFLFILLDYSVRFKWFTHSSIPVLDLFKYYSCNLLSKSYLLLPLALLISFIKVLSHGVISKEILALLTGGMSYKKIFYPFFCFIAINMLFLYFNTELLIPKATTYVTHFEDKFFHGFQKGKKLFKIHQLKLQDDSRIVFKEFHPSSLVLEDAFWIKSFQDIVHIQSLDLSKNPPEGKYVDYLSENSDGLLEKTDSKKSITFSNIKLDSLGFSSLILPPSRQSLSQLYSSLPWRHQAKSDEDAIVLTHFHYKLALPFTLLLAFFGPAPFILSFSRNLPIFYIFSFSLLIFISFFMLLESCLILAESGVIYPPLAIWLPFSLFFAIAINKFRKVI